MDGGQPARDPTVDDGVANVRGRAGSAPMVA
jgi:hypothetical protein